METLMAVLVLSGAVTAQEPIPPHRPPPGRDLQELERRAARLRDLLNRMEAEPEAHQKRREELRGLEEEIGRQRAALEAALQRLNAHLQKNPDDAESWLHRADVRRKLGDPEGAEADTDHALQRKPELRLRLPPEPPRPPHPPEKADELRSWLRENEPETFRRLSRVERGGGRDEAMEMLRAADGRRNDMEELRRRDPQAFEHLATVRRMDRESIELGERLRRASEAEREEGVRRLTDLLSRLFDLREQARTRELEDLRRRVEELETRIQRRKDKKDSIVERRKEQLLGELQDDW